MTFRTLVSARPGLWLHEDVAEWRDGLPRDGASIAASGRGQILRSSCQGIDALIKTCRRGGLLRGVLPDAFASSHRAVAEAKALERLSEKGLSPRCLALEISGGLLKRLRIAVEEVPGARDILALSCAGVEDAEPLARAAGEAVRGMHEAGVAHADLNAANLLARRDGGIWRTWIIDFDGAHVGDRPVSGGRRLAGILRLCRSIDKWEPTARLPIAARQAFLEAALPAELVPAAMRRAQRAQAWRKACGRRPRPLPEKRMS